MTFPLRTEGLTLQSNLYVKIGYGNLCIHTTSTNETPIHVHFEYEEGEKEKQNRRYHYIWSICNLDKQQLPVGEREERGRAKEGE